MSSVQNRANSRSTIVRQRSKPLIVWLLVKFTGCEWKKVMGGLSLVGNHSVKGT